MNVILLVALYMFIPGVVYLITAVFIIRKYLESLKEIRIGLPTEKKIEAIEFQKLLYLAILPMTSFFYGCFLFIMVISAGDLQSYQWDLVLYIGIFLGTANVLAIIGMGYYYHGAIDEFITDPRILLENGKPYNPFIRSVKYSEKTKEMIRKQTFMKHLALGLGPHSISVFAFLLAILIITFSGIVGNESSSSEGTEVDETVDHPINATHTEEVRTSSYVMIISALFTLIAAIFLPRIKKGSLSDQKVFITRVVLVFFSQFPMVIGLVISWILIF